MKSFIKTGRSFYGTGMACIAFQQFIYSDFRPVILPTGWPAWIHASAVWAYIISAAIIIAGLLIITSRKGREAALLLGGFLLLLFIAFQAPNVLFIGPYSPVHLGLWTDPLKELALSGGAFVVAGSFPSPVRSDDKKDYLFKVLESLIPLGRIFFCITMISFGIDHFYYTDIVATLVPSWIPGHVFWAYFAGVALAGSGIAIILKIKLKLVALLLSTMIFLWLIMLHIPRAITDPYSGNGNEITSVFEALAFSGIALLIAVMADYKSSNARAFNSPALQ